MGQAIIYYLVNGIKLAFPEFDRLNPKPEVPRFNNMQSLKNFVEENTTDDKESEIIIDTDKGHILLDFK